jgi:hypothetical protein
MSFLILRKTILKIYSVNDIKNYSAQEWLKNGVRVAIRAIRPDDRDALLKAFKWLEER